MVCVREFLVTMSGFFYYVGAVFESVLSVFGVRATYEHPKYQVVGHINDQVEIRAYGPRTAVETPIDQANDGAAFGRLFRYITGANQGASKISMTVPVEMAPQRIAMTVPVEMTSPGLMRFFLPESVVEKGAPAPTDPLVHFVQLPPQTFAVLHFSGTLTPESRREHQQQLMDAVAASGRHAVGEPSVLSYDPPFALPFVRHNEVAVGLMGEK